MSIEQQRLGIERQRQRRVCDALARCCREIVLYRRRWWRQWPERRGRWWWQFI